MPTAPLSSDDLLRLRMHAQLLSADPSTSRDAPGPEGIAAAARHMFAVQGQDWRSSRWALGLRAPGTHDDDVLRAFDEGRIVRAWPMRSTLHVVPAEDIGWIQRATNHRVLPGAPRRREFLGLDERTLDRLIEVTVAALRGGHSLDRGEASALWTEAGVEWRSNWRYHVLWWMCQNGITTFGPVNGSAAEPRLVLADEWIRAPRSLEGDEALAEIAARYVAPRGAVTAKDLSWWSGLTMKEVRRGLELAAEEGRITPIALEPADGTGRGAQLWAAPEVLEAALGPDAPRAPEWRLLPAFDEHLLGYTDRSAQLAPEHFEHIVPGRNGMFLATVAHLGRVVATWRRGTRKAEPVVVTALPGEQVKIEALEDAIGQWREFSGPAQE